LKKNFLIYTLGSSIYALISTLLIPLFLKDLDIDSYGNLSIAFITINLLIVIFGISIQNSVIRYFVEYPEIVYRKKAINSFIAYIFFLTISLFIFYFFAKYFQLNTYFEYGNLLFIILWVISRIIIQAMLGVLRVDEKSIKYLIVSLSEILVILICLFVYRSYEPLTFDIILFSYSMASVGAVVISVLLLKEYINFHEGISVHFLKYSLSFGVPLALANLVSYFLNFGNRYILLNYHTSYSVGIYEVAHKFGSVLSLLLVSGFTLAFTPYFLKLYKNETLDIFQLKIKQTIHLFMWVYFFFGILLLSLDDLLINLIDKPEYLQSLEFLLEIILGNAIYVLFMLLTISLSILKKTKYELYITLIALFIGGALMFPLIKYYSVYGAAYSLIINSSICLILMMLYNSFYFKIKINLINILAAFLIFILCGILETNLVGLYKLFAPLISLFAMILINKKKLLYVIKKYIPYKR
jgi:O-antigen/teichoic acid export membrane protein